MGFNANQRVVAFKGNGVDNTDYNHHLQKEEQFYERETKQVNDARSNDSDTKYDGDRPRR